MLLRLHQCAYNSVLHLYDKQMAWMTSVNLTSITQPFENGDKCLSFKPQIPAWWRETAKYRWEDLFLSCRYSMFCVFFFLTAITILILLAKWI